VVVVVDDVESASAVSKRLSDLGDRVKPLGGHPGLFIVSSGSKRRSAAVEVGKALSGLDADIRVEPLLEDEHGNRVVPTGKVTVRFKSEPSNDDLRRFADSMGLSFISRNKYVPSQVSFRTSRSDQITELMERIPKFSDNIIAAWPETLGVYRRI
jgi:hypothetical protein